MGKSGRPAFTMMAANPLHGLDAGSDEMEPEPHVCPYGPSPARGYSGVGTGMLQVPAPAMMPR